MMILPTSKVRNCRSIPQLRVKFSAEHTRERLANNRMDRKSQKMHGARKEKNFANNSRACEQRITNNRKLYLRKKTFFQHETNFMKL